MSFGLTITHWAWIAYRLVSSKKTTRRALLASRKVQVAALWKCRSVWKFWAISRTRHGKERLPIRSSVDVIMSFFCKLLQSCNDEFLHLSSTGCTLFILFYWSIVDLQCCVNFCYIAKWSSYIYIYVYICNLHILFHDGLSQDTEHSSLCSTVGPCCLSLLYVIVCIC